MQKPHPPMWVAATSPRTFVEAGERGLGVLCFVIAPPEDLPRRIQPYREAIGRAQPAGAFVNNQVAGFTLALCHDDAAEAQRIGGPAAIWYMNMLSQNLGAWRSQHIAGYEYYGEWERGPVAQARGGAGTLIDNGTFCIGDPDTCAAIVARYAAAGVDQIICLMQVGRIPHAAIMRSIELFGERVIPQFR
ncbi:MAG: LLM class flavin-dependent oxidoreductase [Dehalococcoidia bacterium]